MKSLRLMAALLAICPHNIPAQLVVATIRDVVYAPGGEAFSGVVTIEAQGGTPLRLSIPVSDGLLLVSLPLAEYSVKFIPQKGPGWSESWKVDSNSSGRYLTDVRKTSPVRGDGEKRRDITLPVAEADISGLLTSLTAINITLSNSTRTLAAMADGIQGAVTLTTAASQVPVGPIDGFNLYFTMSSASPPGTLLKIFKNGQRLQIGLDVSLSGATLTFATAPQVGDTLLVDFSQPSSGNSQTRAVTLPIPMNGVSGLPGAISAIRSSIADLDVTIGSLNLSTIPLIGVTPIYGEIPTGKIDGTNLAFVLSKPPSSLGQVQVFVNGLREASGLDFVTSGKTITFLSASAPQIGDTVSADYLAKQ